MGRTGEAVITAAATRATAWSRVTSRVSAYVPTTVRRAPRARAASGVPKSTMPASSTRGQPRVKWEKSTPSCAADSQGWKNSGAPPSGVVNRPARRASTCHRYTGSSRFHDRPGKRRWRATTEITTAAAPRATSGQYVRSRGRRSRRRARGRGAAGARGSPAVDPRREGTCRLRRGDIGGHGRGRPPGRMPPGRAGGRMAVVEVQGLRKEYRRGRRRRTVALDGVDVEVPEGGVFGFLGPNGAG